jgi:carboxymethylenebutenolidase
MGSKQTIVASDGHEMGAYRSDASGDVRGGVVVLQEIFGVNAHIRDVCDRFATDGYTAIAPALYDRSSQKNVELGYVEENVAIGRKLTGEFSWNDTILDVDAAAAVLRSEGLKVGTVGYCWGGSISFLSAFRLSIDAAVAYYGGHITSYLGEKDHCPLLMHFGRKDSSIPLTDVETIQRAYPEAVVHLYDAEHGFNCDRRSQYEPEASGRAKQETLSFFERYLGKV